MLTLRITEQAGVKSYDILVADEKDADAVELRSFQAQDFYTPEHLADIYASVPLGEYVVTLVREGRATAIRCVGAAPFMPPRQPRVTMEFTLKEPDNA